jgi:hypothetical protein
MNFDLDLGFRLEELSFEMDFDLIFASFRLEVFWVEGMTRSVQGGFQDQPKAYFKGYLWTP